MTDPLANVERLLMMRPAELHAACEAYLLAGGWEKRGRHVIFPESCWHRRALGAGMFRFEEALAIQFRRDGIGGVT